MKLCSVLIAAASVAVLTGCSKPNPTVGDFEGTELRLSDDRMQHRYLGTDGMIRLTCAGRTKDNEGCGGAAVYFEKLDQSCLGSWWVKKQYGDWQIVVVWRKQYAPHCYRLPDTDYFGAADFKPR